MLVARYSGGRAASQKGAVALRNIAVDCGVSNASLADTPLIAYNTLRSPPNAAIHGGTLIQMMCAERSAMQGGARDPAAKRYQIILNRIGAKMRGRLYVLMYGFIDNWIHGAVET